MSTKDVIKGRDEPRPQDKSQEDWDELEEEVDYRPAPVAKLDTTVVPVGGTLVRAVSEKRIHHGCGDVAELGDNGNGNRESERRLVGCPRANGKRRRQGRAHDDVGRRRCPYSVQTHPHKLELAANREPHSRIPHHQANQRTDDYRPVKHVLAADAGLHVDRRRN